MRPCQLAARPACPSRFPAGNPRPPALNQPGGDVHNPVFRHPFPLIAEPLGLPVVAGSGGREYLDHEQQLANRCPVPGPPSIHQGDHEQIRFDQRVLIEDEILQPDLFVCRTRGGVALRDWHEVEALLLVIEVLSPSTAPYDRGLKRRRYQRAGVPEYWVVDIDARAIERWRPDDTSPEIVTGTLRLTLEESQPESALDVAAVFAKAAL